MPTFQYDPNSIPSYGDVIARGQASRAQTMQDYILNTQRDNQASYNDALRMLNENTAAERDAENDADRAMSLQNQLLDQKQRDAESLFNLQTGVLGQALNNLLTQNRLRRQSLNDLVALSRQSASTVQTERNPNPWFGPMIVEGRIN